MRQILFRGYNRKNQKWLYGYYVVNRGVHLIVEDGIANPLNTWEDYAVDPGTAGQYTGLEDRSGQDVYEGDLLRTSEGNIMIAEWVGSGIVTRCLTPTYDGMMNTNRYAFPVSEKIGNIHDNPELLEDKK